MKLVKMEGLMRNNEIPRKNATYDDIKSDKKIKFKFRQHIFWNIFLGLRCGFFLNETSILVFAKSAIFHSI